MRELVMVADAKWLNERFGESSNIVIQVNEESFIESINNNHQFIARNVAEINNAYKQIVSYCLIACKNDIFITQRTTKQTEERLHNKYSIGIGGHISSVDNKTDNKTNDIVITGMLRELYEEVEINTSYSWKFYGIINDNSTEVNSVHTGVCFLIELDNECCRVKEVEKMHGF